MELSNFHQLAPPVARVPTPRALGASVVAEASVTTMIPATSTGPAIPQLTQPLAVATSANAHPLPSLSAPAPAKAMGGQPTTSVAPPAPPPKQQRSDDAARREALRTSESAKSLAAAHAAHGLTAPLSSTTTVDSAAAGAARSSTATNTSAGVRSAAISFIVARRELQHHVLCVRAPHSRLVHFLAHPHSSPTTTACLSMCSPHVQTLALRLTTTQCPEMLKWQRCSSGRVQQDLFIVTEEVERRALGRAWQSHHRILV